jgi:hypothetical protein
MPVVINEFEVLAEPAPPPSRPEDSQHDHANGQKKIEPLQLAPALARLAERAMRIWAH